MGTEREPRGHDSHSVLSPKTIDERESGLIQGAFGTIRLEDRAPRRSWRGRLLTLAAIIGPGIIVLVGDNDAGGVATYAQAGQNFGYTLLWTLLLLVPVLIVNQEMVVRLGAVTGVGLAKLITERFGRFWGWYSVGGLFLLNFLVISTEFIGVTLAAEYFGFNRYIVVPLATVVLIGITVSGNFRRWERSMFVFLFASLLVLPLAALSHPDPGAALRGFFVPGMQGGLTSAGALMIFAIVGTTVAPWQLFFQQSNVVDKRITPRWLEYEKADTALGAAVVVIGAAAIIVASASAFSGAPEFGHFKDGLGVAQGIARHINPTVGAIFALLLLDASIVGASAVTLATSYAFGDIFGVRQSLNRRIGEARTFYGSFTAMVALAAGLVLIPGAPLGLITTAVQVLAGILLPSATVFALLLCNDAEVLGPWINKPWLNVIAVFIVGVLLALSVILVMTTVFPAINVVVLTIVLAVFVVAGAVVAGVWGLQAQRQLAGQPVMSRQERENWRMPALALLQRPRWSPVRRVAVVTLSGYLVLAILMLVVRAVQLAIAR
ncbi:MAG TPA: NRAMP family divalent metal transporter [Candidatus Dormibacteraeota bacterium]|nr:NRAMP family divalent metal transporter [Candidatus Dormibacteraeota bacterium]